MDRKPISPSPWASAFDRVFADTAFSTDVELQKDEYVSKES